MTERTPNVVHLILAALVGAVISGAVLSESPGSAAAPEKAEAKTRSLSRAFQAAAETVRPSVLNITTERWVGGQRHLPLVRMAERIFGQKATPTLKRSFGTAFVVRADGTALTNHHVVKDAKRVLAHLHDGTEVSAQVMASDAPTDLAVLKLDARPDGKPYVPVTFGDSDALRIGDWILAAGNPFGLGQTVTVGIVSAKGRSRVGLAAYEDFIQTDTAINPGNSGGPLLDLDGKVVGITTAIASSDGNSSGVGFAIPITMAREVMAKLLDQGRVVRGWLGVGLQEASPDLMRRLGFGETQGALINQVLEGGPADGKLKAGDLITALNGVDVSDSNRLKTLVAETEVGKEITLDLKRAGKAIQVALAPTERPSSAKNKKAPEPEPDAASQAVGISCREITPQLARFFGFREWKPEDKGVVIVRVDPRSMAARHGVGAGMILQQLESTPIHTLDDVDQAKAGIEKEQGVLMRVWDGRTSNFVLLK